LELVVNYFRVTSESFSESFLSYSAVDVTEKMNCHNNKCIEFRFSEMYELPARTSVYGAREV